MADKEKLHKAAQAAQAMPARPGLSVLQRAQTLGPAGRPPASKAAAPIEDAFDPAAAVAFRFAFLGSGQGGGRIADAFYRLGYRRVAALNTTDTDFAGLSEGLHKFSLGVGGAAKDAALAKAQYLARRDDVWDLMTRAWGSGADYALICASLGGGTGSGTVAPLVETARAYLQSKDLPARVGAVVSLPSASEGQKQAHNTVTAFKELLALNVSPLIVIDNARINQLYRPAIAELHPIANEAVSVLLHLFNQLAARKSNYTTFDKSELGQLLDGGVAVLGVANFDPDSITSPADISSKIRDELDASVLATVDLRTGRKAGCVFVAHPDVLNRFSADYFDAGFTQLDRIIGTARPGADVVVHRGLYDDESTGLQCYTLVSHLDPPLAKLAELAHRAGLGEANQPASVARYLGLQ
jgi:cell division GTPase FtsZ